MKIQIRYVSGEATEHDLDGYNTFEDLMMMLSREDPSWLFLDDMLIKISSIQYITLSES